MSEHPARLPHWVQTGAGWLALLATLTIALSIVLHLRNYRRPFQQRLMIRIQLIVPLFALLCYCMLVQPEAIVCRFVIEPAREIYEAFVIYTFFLLLCDLLGGAKSIVIMTSGRPPVQHPGLVRFLLPPLDISDPRTFLAIKRGILQYVWLKPVICFGTLFAELCGWYNVNDLGPRSLYLWFTVLYNFSVSLSLYCLAIFWKILWADLRPFNPVGKFLCVKLIIFASYWQGVILAILSFAGLLPGAAPEGGATNLGLLIQNALLCYELVLFACGHWLSFSYKPFTISHIPNGRLQFYHAFRDMVGMKDLFIDFALTFRGDYYKDYKTFDSVDAIIAHPTSKSRMSRINQGLRYQTDGKPKHWLPQHASQAPKSTDNQLSRQSLYAPSLVSGGTSTRGIYPNSPQQEPTSPLLSDVQSITTNQSLEEIGDVVLRLNPTISYEFEGLNEDEMYYQAACAVVNNYSLDQSEVKKLINYPIVDELVMGHEYGFKVKKLRADRLRQQQYGSVDSSIA